MPDKSGNYNLKCVSPINVILRKQWIENERLAYPIIQIPLEMTDLRPGFFRNRMMWIGFTVAGVISLLNGLNFLYPSVPRIPIKEPNYGLGVYFNEEPWNAIGTLPLRFYPFLIWSLVPNPLKPHLLNLVFLFIPQTRAIGRCDGWPEHYPTISILWETSHRCYDRALRHGTLLRSPTLRRNFQKSNRSPIRA